MSKTIKGPDGNMYKPMQYPMYRKIGDSNLYKMISVEEFINVVDKGEAAIIGWGKMAPAAIPGFMQASQEATDNEFDTLHAAVLKKIENL